MASIINSLRDQHVELVGLAKQIEELLLGNSLDECVDHVRSLLARFVGHLDFHLITEDEHIYPILMDHENEQVRATARRFKNELGGLANAVEAYKSRWRSREAMLGNPEGFVHETRLVFAALAQRIEKEDRELFSLYERG